MRFERTDSFKADYRRLPARQQAMFREAMREFAVACDRWVAERQAFPAKLRVKDVQGAAGVLEMTWTFAGPDGRATWEWVTVDVVDKVGFITREPAVRWRRVGSHQIFAKP